MGTSLICRPILAERDPKQQPKTNGQLDAGYGDCLRDRTL